MREEDLHARIAELAAQNAALTALVEILLTNMLRQGSARDARELRQALASANAQAPSAESPEHSEILKTIIRDSKRLIVEIFDRAEGKVVR